MDKYDEEIAELTATPADIKAHWNQASPLFQFAENHVVNGQVCGCLTQIRGDRHYVVQDRPDLTKEIRNDKRIPASIDQVTVDDLPIFAEWQRRLDKELARV